VNELHTEIRIDAAPDQVWAVLTDFERYPEWNPFIESIAGGIEPSTRLRVRIAPPGGRAMTLKPAVTESVTGEVFEWLGNLPVPGLFAGRHRFELHRISTPGGTGTRFVQHESFKGILVPALGRLLRKTVSGFEAMNEALKARAENATARTR
jgi:hypothetical protein